MFSKIASFALFVLFLANVNALYENHRISGTKTWTYVSKFCFNPDSDETGGEYKGLFQYKVYFPKNTSLKWYVYYHGADSWRAAYDNKDSGCIEKGNIAYKTGNVFSLYDKPSLKTVDHSDSIFSKSPNSVQLVEGELVFRAKRARWFYFALGNCHSRLNKHGYMVDETVMQPKEAEVKAVVELTMTNGKDSEMHFSADELGKLTTYTSYFVIYLMMFLCPGSYILVTLKKRKMLHHTVKIAMLSFSLETVSIFLGFVYQSSYGSKGYKYVNLDASSAFFHAAADIALLTLLLVIAKGWTIVRRKISAKGRVKIGIFVMLYAATYFGVLIWHYTVGKDPAAITYFYDSPPGQILQWLRVVAIAWFTYACHTTKVNYSSKKTFYCIFYLVGITWLAALPLQVVLANTLSLWYRSAFIANFELTFNLLVYIGFFVLFWPSTFNKNFPFHAKTSDMEDAARTTLNASNVTNVSKQRFGSHNRKASGAGTPGSSHSSVPGDGFVTHHPAGFNRVVTSPSRRNTGRGNAAISGGAVFGSPYERISKSLINIRGKLTSIHDASDDIEYALEELENPYDEEDEDLPSENEHNVGGDQTSDQPSQRGERVVETMELPAVRKKKKKKAPRPPE